MSRDAALAEMVAEPSAGPRSAVDSLAAARTVLAGQAFSRFLGAEMVECSSERVVIELLLRDELKQNNGFAHGGVLAYLADVALSFAAGSAVGADVVTAEFTINYLRPAVGEKLVARATALAAGRTQGVSRCDIFTVTDGVERLCAAAQGSVLRTSQGRDRPGSELTGTASLWPASMLVGDPDRS